MGLRVEVVGARGPAGSHLPEAQRTQALRIEVRPVDVQMVPAPKITAHRVNWQVGEVGLRREVCQAPTGIKALPSEQRAYAPLDRALSIDRWLDHVRHRAV
ncbi:MAG: hypothetical protein HGA45_28140 [Chloroflexales bacterium]|nr:hypothetical protein [Chloroflexales bacterium]